MAVVKLTHNSCIDGEFKTDENLATERTLQLGSNYGISS